MRRASVVVLAAGAVWGVVSAPSMAHGITLSRSDDVHYDHESPLTFAAHTLGTLAGPVDGWTLDPSALTGDMAAWVAGMMAILTAAALPQGRSGELDRSGR